MPEVPQASSGRSGLVVGELHHLLDELLAAVVGGVALAGDDELDRPLVVQQQRLEPGRVLEHEREPLVGGHPPGEADGQHVGVEGGLGPAELGLGRPPGQRGGADPAAHLLDQPPAQQPPGAPQLTGVDPVHAVEVHLAPDRRRVALAGGLGAQLEQLAGGPGRGVHAVGDGADRHVVGVEARPQRAEHVPADVAVQLAHAVGALPQPQAHVRHVELARVVLRAQREELLHRHPEAGEVPLDQRPGEPVDPGGHRGVGGEDRAAAHRLQRLTEGQAVGLGQLADPLDALEAGVALVGVEHLGLRGPGQRAERPDGADAADAQQHLLPQPVVLSPAVQPVGDPALDR
jgi:hypothetical protein